MDMWQRQAKALALVERIIALNPDESTVAYAKKMRKRLELPMARVLEQLWPELQMTDKCEKLGITRQAYRGWVMGMYRPSRRQAFRLAKETGYDVYDILGKARR